MQEVWIGLVEVTGDSRNPHLQGCRGAYVNVVGAAHDMPTFEKTVIAAVADLGLSVEGFEWAEPLSLRLEKFDLEQYLLDLAEAAERTGTIQFGAFHAWENEDA